MKIKDAEYTTICCDKGDESRKAIELLRREGVYPDIKDITGPLPIDFRIIGRGMPREKIMGFITTATAPTLIVHWRPGKTTVLEGLEHISEGLKSDWE